MHALSVVTQLFRGLARRRGVNSLNSAYVSPNDHIVIGGCGRSGTTLLRVIVDSHPRICCGPESEAFLAGAIHLTRLKDRYKLDRQVLRDAYVTSRSRAEFIDWLAEVCRAATGKPRWAEKTPRNILNLDFIFSKFPQAKFVHVLRDGRDVACSLRTHPRHRVKNGKLVPVNTWKPMKLCVQRWRDSLLCAKRRWSNPRFYTVRYEELVTDPRETVSKLMKFLEEPWNERLLAHTEAASIYRDATTFAQTPEANKPIETSSIGRWRRDMSDDDKRIFKEIAGELLIECGYAADNDW